MCFYLLNVDLNLFLLLFLSPYMEFFNVYYLAIFLKSSGSIYVKSSLFQQKFQGYFLWKCASPLISAL